MTSTSDYYVPNYFNKEYQSSLPSINGLLRSGLFISRQPGVNSQLSIPDSGQEIETTNLSKRIKEIEFEIDTINTKYDEMKTKLTKELENEINLRKKVEDECTKKIEEYIDAAKNLSLVKNYTLKGFKEHNIKNRVIKCAHKITFINVTDMTKEFLYFIRTKIDQIKSTTNTKFIYEIRFHHTVANKFIRQRKSYQYFKG